MADIGGGWKKEDKNNKPYISFSIDKALLPLTIDSTKSLKAFPIKDKSSDNAPDFRLVLFSNEEQKEITTAPAGEDFPF